MYKDKDIKTKIKIYNDEVCANYQNNRIMILYVLSCNTINIILDSIFVNSDKKYYQQMSLKVCNKKKTKKKKTINENLKLSESDDDKSILRLYYIFFL